MNGKVNDWYKKKDGYHGKKKLHPGPSKQLLAEKETC